MANLSAVQRLTGTTGGETPLVDGTMRTAIVAVLNALLVVGSHLVHLSDADTLIIVALASPMAVILFGVWDRFMSPRLTAPLALGSSTRRFGADGVLGIANADAEAPTATDVSDAMKAVRLPEDKRIKDGVTVAKRPAFRMNTQPRTSSGQFASKPKKKKR